MTTKRRAVVTAAFLCLALFAGLAFAVISEPAVARADAAFDALWTPWRVEPLLGIFLWITALGSGATLVAVVVTATALLWTSRRRPLLLPLWTVYLGTEFTTWIVKYAMGRGRPAFIDVARAVSPSFPSAHAAGSAAVYGFLAYMVVRDLRESGSIKVAIPCAAAVMIATIAFSRVFLSLHHTTDVLGGLILAVIWLCAGVAMADRARA